MAEQLEIIIQNTTVVRERMSYAWQAVNKALQDGAVVVTLGRENKTRAMEKKYHAMIGDIAKQVTFFGTKRYGVDTWKALLVDKFEQEKKAQGEPLSHPGRLIPSMDGERMVSIRASTREFRKKEASDFIEFLYAEGCDMGVQWSSKAEEIYQQYREAA